MHVKYSIDCHLSVLVMNVTISSDWQV